MNNLSVDGGKYMDFLWQFLTTYGPKLIGAVLVLVIGLWLIRWIVKGMNGMMVRAKIDESLRPFLKSLSSVVLKLLLAISIMGMLGIEMASFIAILASAGFAVGMALSGTLQNFAGGVIILIFKPYRVGDFIEAQGYSGTVREIQIFNTVLNTPDNKTIIIPNGGLSTGSLINFSAQETRRVDWTFGIGYGDDIVRAKEVLQRLLDEDDRILSNPSSFIGLSELADSSVNFVVRAWVKAADYWPVFFEMNEKVYTQFDKHGLNIPYPQMDVHLINQ